MTQNEHGHSNSGGKDAAAARSRAGGWRRRGGTGRCSAVILFLLAPFLTSLFGEIPVSGDPRTKVDPVVRIRAYGFDLSEVKLLDGPFKEAMERDAAYLLTVEPDRLLHRFRLYAGLEPKAPLYGGWETMGISGHSLGHYLSACSRMFAATGRGEFKERVDYIVTELDVCQRASGNGYVGGVEDGKRVFAEVASGNIRTKPFELSGVWVPWYTQHKLFAGLWDAYRYCAGKRALSVVTKLGDWADQVTSGLSDEQFQEMLACEHGGMNEVLAELYAVTGNKKYLRLSRRFHHRAVLDPLGRQEDLLSGLHGNTQIPKIIGVARRYELTGDVSDRSIADFFWNRVVHHHSYVTGGHGEFEHFGPPDQLNTRLSSSTTESCNTYNMLKLTRHLIAWSPKAEYADYYERALYNHILASQDPDSGMMCYFVPLDSGDFKRYSKPFNSFTCCHGTGMENHAKYGDSIYFHDDNGVFVNLFIPSVLEWKEKGLILRQETAFPRENTTGLQVTTTAPLNLAIRIRRPGWAEGPLEIRVDGEVVHGDSTTSGYVELKRTWETGDRIEVSFPMKVRLEAMPDNPDRVALFYGPILLAGDLGPVEKEGEAVSPPVTPSLVTDRRDAGGWTERVDRDGLSFITSGVGRPVDVRLIPFWEMHHRRYAVYWDLFTPRQWEVLQPRLRAERNRRRLLDVRTIDVFQPGVTEAEQAHGLRGQRMETGEFSGRRYRQAFAGGWFEFVMKVEPEAAQELQCTYWSYDRRGRLFDILVDGTLVGTQSLEEKRDGEFFEVTYPLPGDLTRGKRTVVVRFQPHEEKWAGALFGARVLRVDSTTDQSLK